jgi:DNA polymerase V
MVGYATRSSANCRAMPVLPFKRNVVDDVMMLADRVAVSKPPHWLQRLRLPLFAGKVSAGFPSPAADHIEKNLDLNELLIQKPAATYFVRAQGESMLGAGIHPNDILVVDRSLEPAAGKVVICALNGELTVKRLTCENEQWALKAENPDYPDILLSDDLELVVWGVVTNVIHPV